MPPSILSEKSLSQNYWNAYTETMPREPLDALHLKRIQKMLHYAYERVPFYRNLYQKAGFKPEDIRTLDDFNTIVPAIDKKDLVDAQRAAARRDRVLGRKREHGDEAEADLGAKANCACLHSDLCACHGGESQRAASRAACSGGRIT